LPKIQRKSMLPSRCSQPACVNIDVNAVTSQPSPIREQVSFTSHGRKPRVRIERSSPFGSS
jgi:hypothetical protein